MSQYCSCLTLILLLQLAEELSKCYKIEKYNLSSMCHVKCYNYTKLVLGYGPDKGAMVTTLWRKDKKAFNLCFGTLGSASLAHSLIRQQLVMYLNHHKSMVLLVQLLNETYEPLSSVLHLSPSPQLGINSAVSISIGHLIVSPIFCFNVTSS